MIVYINITRRVCEVLELNKSAWLSYKRLKSKFLLFWSVQRQDLTSYTYSRFQLYFKTTRKSPNYLLLNFALHQRWHLAAFNLPLLRLLTIENSCPTLRERRFRISRSIRFEKKYFYVPYFVILLSSSKKKKKYTLLPCSLLTWTSSWFHCSWFLYSDSDLNHGKLFCSGDSADKMVTRSWAILGSVPL